jgi:hypothetical protein
MGLSLVKDTGGYWEERRGRGRRVDLVPDLIRTLHTRKEVESGQVKIR